MEPTNDRVRVIDLGNNKIYMKQTDPYGFIYINFDKGQLPEDLKSAFTSFEYAKRAIDQYLSRKKRGRVVTDETFPETQPRKEELEVNSA